MYLFYLKIGEPTLPTVLVTIERVGSPIFIHFHVKDLHEIVFIHVFISQILYGWWPYYSILRKIRTFIKLTVYKNRSPFHFLIVLDLRFITKVSFYTLIHYFITDTINQYYYFNTWCSWPADNKLWSISSTAGREGRLSESRPITL